MLHFHSPLPLHFPNTLSTKPRFQCSVKINDTPKQVTNSPILNNNNVLVLWDLDNKPPDGAPYDAALSLKTVAEAFGNVVGISAYTNRHTFFKLPQWSPNDQLPDHNNLICRFCHRDFESDSDLKNHILQIHKKRQFFKRQKIVKKFRSLKVKRSKPRFFRRIHKYNDAASTFIVPEVGFGLGSELRRAGVFVKAVEDKVVAADWLLKREVKHSIVDWFILVSDCSEFSDILKKARKEKNLGIVVVGDYWDRALGREADMWLPWVAVVNGKVEEIDLVPKKKWRRTITREKLDENENEDEDEDEDLDVEYTTEDDEDEFYVY